MREQHGGAGTSLHNRWKSMRQRCVNPKAEHYAYYGGRGITVCPEWDSFIAFRSWALANGYEESLELDRRDNDGNYEPGNCRWVTRPVNSQNRRWAINLTALGETKTLAEWSRDPRCVVSYSTLYTRIRRNGWPHEAAITQVHPWRPGRQPHNKRGELA